MNDKCILPLILLSVLGAEDGFAQATVRLNNLDVKQVLDFKHPEAVAAKDDFHVQVLAGRGLRRALSALSRSAPPRISLKLIKTAISTPELASFLGSWRIAKRHFRFECGEGRSPTSKPMVLA